MQAEPRFRRELFTPAGASRIPRGGRESDPPGSDPDPPGRRESFTPVGASRAGGAGCEAALGPALRESFTPVRESLTPVDGSRHQAPREPRTPGGASRLPRLWTGQVVSRRYSWGSFWGSVRTSSMITKLASEYMWGR